MNPHDQLDGSDQTAARKERALKERLASQAEVDDTRWLMSTKRGRRVVWRILDRAGVYRLSFNTNSMTMAFNEGMRNEGLRLLSQVQASCPDELVAMIKEAADA